MPKARKRAEAVTPTHGSRGKFAKVSPASTNRLPEAENSTEDLTAGEEGSDLRGRKGKSLSVRERGFIRAYVSGETQGRALASARAVGFGPADSGIGSKILRRPHVKAEIARQLAAQDITADRVLAELRHVAFSDMRDYTTWGPNGVTLKASEELSDLAAAAVAEVSETEGEKSSSLRFKLHDKLGALTTLAKHLRLLTEEEGGSKQVHYHLHTNVDFPEPEWPVGGPPAALVRRNGQEG